MQGSFLQFWGKARDGEESACAWHPVAYHLLDVAAVAKKLLEAREVTRARAAWLLAIDEPSAVQLLLSLAALHDIGKFAPAFQKLATPSGWRMPSAIETVDFSRLQASRHTRDGQVLWNRLRDELIPRMWPVSGDVLDSLRNAVFFHHGWPGTEGGGPFEVYFGSNSGAIDNARDCIDAVLGCITIGPIDAEPCNENAAKIASWWIAGFLTLCDWVGSRVKWFPYTAPDYSDVDLRKYWKLAQERAHSAVREAGLDSPRSENEQSFERLTGIPTPREMQSWTSTCELPEGPLLALVEDQTGSGKTEVAQMFVHRMLAAGRATGAYWAMPTQATANAMFKRQGDTISRLFSPQQSRRPSLVLAHGQSRLHKQYRSTVIDAFSPRVLDDIADDIEEETLQKETSNELPSTTAVSAFLADDRRAALLADIGAGTIDQALLAVLPSRFSTLRLFALSEKVLIVDEVHAFDAYVSTEIQQLLAFHARVGGSAVVLSATLSEERSKDIRAIWQHCAIPIRKPKRFTLASKKDIVPVGVYAPARFPLATLVSASGESTFSPSDAAVDQHRTVPVRMTYSFEDAVSEIEHCARSGAGTVWIRNTVDECLRSAAVLRERGVSVMVFHARFAQGDRQVREAEVVRLFGKHSKANDRRGKVLIATQVVEQSLDIDFDAMVTDLAPIDLLIQRAGRLWRHERLPSERGNVAKELIVLAPDPAVEVDANWPPESVVGKTRYVYEDVDVLWRTWKLLQESPCLETPAKLRHMIHRVYSEIADVNPIFEKRGLNYAGKESSARATARNNLLRIDDGYVNNGGWNEEVRMPTRLGEPQIELRLARFENGVITPWFRDGAESEATRWRLSEVRIAAHKVGKSPIAPSRWRVAVNEARVRWGLWEREIPVVVLEPRDGEWVGELNSVEGTTKFSYDEMAGLQFR